MSEKVRQLLRERFEPRRNVLRGTVTAAPLIDGRSAGYVVATVGGQASVKVRCNPDQQPPFAPGDSIDCQAYGSPAATMYYALNRVAGARGDSGIWQFTQETQYNGTLYAPGDQLLGSTLPGKANWWYVYELGQWRIRSGNNVRGALGNLQDVYGYEQQVFGHAWGKADGDWLGIDEDNGIRMMRGQTTVAQWKERDIVLGEDGEPRLRLRPGAIEFLGPDGTVKAGFDGVTRSVYGWDRWGLPLGPAVEIGPTDDGRWGIWLRGRDNVPFASLLSGTEADPDNVYLRVGAQGAANFLEFLNGNLEVRGTIGGWTIEADRIKGGRAYLQSAGALNLYGGSTNRWVLLDASQATYPMAVGHASAASAPFRVDWDGNVYATSVKQITGSGSTSGATEGIAMFTNTGAGPAIFASGGIYVDGTMGDGYTLTVAGPAYITGNQLALHLEGVTALEAGGDIGVAATGSTSSIKLVSGRLDANSQNIVNVNRLYLGGTTCYLYLSGSDIYWYNGATSVKLN